MRKCNLGDIADIITGPFGSQLHASDYVEKGVPSIMPKDIGDRIVIHDTIAHITEEDARRLSKYRVELGDIVYSRRGDIERCALIKEDDVGDLCGTGCLRVRPDTGKVNPVFLSFYLSTPHIKKWIVDNATGATMPNLNSAILKKLPVDLPDLKVQEKIANELQAIDDKINSNSKVIITLESMAKTIYDYWFVQFDFPDANGRPYKTSGGKMVWNKELGREIPAGWRTTNIGYITENFDSQRIPLSAKERQTMKGEIPYYGATDVMDYVNRPIFTGQYVLIAEDGSVMDNDGFPFVQMIYGDSWVNNHAHVLRGKNGYSNECLYLLLKEIPVVLIKTGSIQAKINQNNLNSYKVVLPPNDIMSVFDDKVIPFFEKLRNLKEENRKLSSLRDFLLPMLMNGQVTFRS